MPKKKTATVFSQVTKQHDVGGAWHSEEWSGLLQLVASEKEAMLKEIPLDLIVEEAAFFGRVP